MLNRCEFIGHLGADPEIRSLQNGDKVANLRLACTERWKSKDGEQRERTEWITVVVWGALSGVAERYLRKGSKVYVAGKWTTRKWTDQSGQDRYSTECVLQGFDAKLVMLDGKPQDGQRDNGGGYDSGGYDQPRNGAPAGGYGQPSNGGPAGGGRSDFDDFPDEIPF